MAHFAQLDENNVVTQIVVIGDEQLKTTVATEVDGFLMIQIAESEAKGVEFCKSLHGADTVWKQTSYNANFRGKYAGIGDTFENGEFVAPLVVISTEQMQSLSTEQMQSLSSEQVQALSTVQVQSLSTDQLQSLSTDQISALEA